MKKVDNAPRCGICGNKLVRNGTTSAGLTRWRCKTCGASITQSRPDITARAQFTMWLDWLLSAGPQRELPVARSMFYDTTAWCWKVVPPAESTGEIHRWIMLDGTYYQDMCVLIAVTQSHVVDWHFVTAKRPWPGRRYELRFRHQILPLLMANAVCWQYCATSGPKPRSSDVISISSSPAPNT